MIDFSKDIFLENSRVLLRPMALKDGCSVAEIACFPDIWRGTTGSISNASEAEGLVELNCREREQGKRYTFSIIDKDDESLVGSTSLGNISERDKRLEIGWTWLTPRAHGSGINTNGKFLLMQYCFELIGVHRIEFKTDILNERSCAALTKIGATREGTLRSHTLMHGGRYRDTVYFGIIEHEWSAVKSRLISLL